MSRNPIFCGRFHVKSCCSKHLHPWNFFFATGNDLGSISGPETDRNQFGDERVESSSSFVSQWKVGSNNVKNRQACSKSVICTRVHDRAYLRSNNLSGSEHSKRIFNRCSILFPEGVGVRYRIVLICTACNCISCWMKFWRCNRRGRGACS